MFARIAVAAVVLPLVAHAQVGYAPRDSPYRDANMSARAALYTGYYFGAKDEAGVLPHSGPLVGVRLDAHVGGPADLTFRLARVGTERDVIDPTRAEGTRVVETQKISLAFMDVGLSFNLTGQKAWHGIMPVVIGSVGIVSDLKGRDIGGFSHGTTFALGYGLGARYAPVHRRIALRADLGSYLYSLDYPSTYYVVGGDGTSVLDSGVPRAQWRNNWTMSVGLTYQIWK